MIETYKILSGKYDTNVVLIWKQLPSKQPGVMIWKFSKLVLNIRHKFYFTNRVVNAWNSLPNWIVMANSTNTFKSRLYTYWQDQGFGATIAKVRQSLTLTLTLTLP